MNKREKILAASAGLVAVVFVTLMVGLSDPAPPASPKTAAEAAPSPTQSNEAIL